MIRLSNMDILLLMNVKLTIYLIKINRSIKKEKNFIENLFHHFNGPMKI